MHRRRLQMTIGIVLGAVLLTGCADDGAERGTTATTCGADGAAVAQGAGGVASGSGIQVTRDGITVTETGEVQVAPDVLVATLGVEVTAETVEAALTRANEQADALVAALREAEVAEQDIQTVEVTVRDQRREGPPDAVPDITGYVARNFVRARIEALDGAGATLQAALDAAGDAARLRSVRLTHEDPNGALGPARDDAFAAARVTAERYAELAGQALGPLVAIQETSAVPPAPVPFAEDVAGGSVPIEPGQQTLTVTITATWALGE